MLGGYDRTGMTVIGVRTTHLHQMDHTPEVFPPAGSGTDMAKAIRHQRLAPRLAGHRSRLPLRSGVYSDQLDPLTPSRHLMADPEFMNDIEGTFLDWPPPKAVAAAGELMRHSGLRRMQQSSGLGHRSGVCYRYKTLQRPKSRHPRKLSHRPKTLKSAMSTSRSSTVTRAQEPRCRFVIGLPRRGENRLLARNSGRSR